MKSLRFAPLALLTFVALFITGCQEDEVKSDKTIVPATFRVDIPSSISYTATSGRQKSDTLNGNEIYRHLGTFINVGKTASELVEGIIHGISVYNIDKAMTMSFNGEDDNRVKNLVVTESSTFDGTTWDYQLTVTDALSEGADDGGKAIQIFWNDEAPIRGVAIVKPYNCDRPTNLHIPDAMFRVDYSEDGTLGYDAHMIVTVAGLTLADEVTEPFSMNNLKMFAGRKGDIVDVYGNSNHPNAKLFSDEKGFNWSFVASSDRVKNIGVAEVGLPFISVNSTDRAVLLEDYSIYNVFHDGIMDAWPGIDQEKLQAFLTTAAAPGYFDDGGFIAGGTSPGADWNTISGRIDDLIPYNPSSVNSLTLSFK
ncbi:MAG TPA: hypothetical protein VD927_19265 [Chryseosolibacter sp.]|nr:hypothetical protein [Chryseosolibacter sp.]